MTAIKKNWVLIIPILVLVIALIFTLKNRTSETNQKIGMIETAFIDVASELPGRLDSLLVELGDTVKIGQKLARLKPQKISTLVDQSRASIDVAQNQLKLITNGSSQEVIDGMKNLYEISKDQLELAEKTYERMNNLYKEGVISGQEKEVFEFKYKAAQKELETAKKNYQLIQKGSRPETIAVATAMVKHAKKNAELVDLVSEELILYAPRAGVISSLLIEEGEITSIGYPVITILDPTKYYALFQIRQNEIQNYKEGTEVVATIPGVSNSSIRLKVTFIAPMLDFANWVPSGEKGEFDLKTFEVRMTPIEKHDEIKPGMTLAID